jgi:hypothetical protein
MSLKISQTPNRVGVILIGFPKCGTTAMHGYFASHPDFNALLVGDFNCEIDTIGDKVGGDLYRQALLSSQQCLFRAPRKIKMTVDYGMISAIIS